ncbi:MAG: PQQ-binding-like beta-propeller repeat protein [Haloferacaceae archaeon]
MSRGPRIGRRAFLAGTAGGAAALAGARPAAAQAIEVSVPGSLLYALDRETGEAKWSRRLPPLWNRPALAGDVLVAGTGERIVGLSPDGGEERWRLDRGVLDSPEETEGTGVAAADGRAYAATADGSVVAVDAASGDVDWTFAFGEGASAARTTPVAAGGALYAVAESGTLVSLDPATGDERWRTATRSAPAYAVGAGADRAYVGGGSNIAAYDAADGSEAWGHPSLSTSAPIPTLGNGHLYVSGEGGSFHTLDPATGEQRWRTDLGVRNEFDFAGDRAYVAAGDIVAAVGGDGAVLDRFGLPIAAASGTAVADGRVHVAANDGMLRALSTDDGSVAWATDLRDDSLRSGENETAPVWLFTTPVVEGDTVYAGTTLTEIGSPESGPGGTNLLTQFALILVSVLGAGYAVRRFTHGGPK